VITFPSKPELRDTHRFSGIRLDYPLINAAAIPENTGDFGSTGLRACTSTGCIQILLKHCQLGDRALLSIPRCQRIFCILMGTSSGTKVNLSNRALSKGFNLSRDGAFLV
jgi:hypothetical protein